MKLEDYIATIENYPKEGVTFRDISPLMADGNAYSYAIRESFSMRLTRRLT